MNRILILILLIMLSITAARASTIVLPQTGQSTSYATGDDGALRHGMTWPSLRFSDNGNQTVTDKLTGLTWAKDANLMKSRDPSFDTDISNFYTYETANDGAVTWQHALDYVKKLNDESYLGYTDWRLPNRNEMASLVNVAQLSSATWLNSQGFLMSWVLTILKG